MDKTKRRRIAAIEALRKSEGWQLMRQTMLDEIDVVARQMAAAPSMNESEMHFRRGMLHASYLMTDMPDKLHQRLEADLMIEDGIEKAKEARD